MRPRFAALAESNASLWIMAASPVFWSLHFLVCYGVAAISCGRLGDGSASTMRVIIAGLTVAALLAIAGVSAVAFGWHRAAGDPPPHDADTPEDRRGFMGFATLLLSGLSALGVIYSGLAAVFIRTCE